MASKRAERAAARRLRDKWRAKQWYTIVTPDMFGRKEIASTPADDPQKVIGRVAETTMYDLTGNFKLMHLKVYFQVEKVQGNQALTKFIGHDTTSDYIRRMVRRRRARLDAIFPVTTSDGYKLRVKVIGIAPKRIKTSIKMNLRKRITEYLIDKASKMTMAEFVGYMLSPSTNDELVKLVRDIYPLKRVEIRKSEVLLEPTEKVVEMREEEEEKKGEEESPEQEGSEGAGVAQPGGASDS